MPAELHEERLRAWRGLLNAHAAAVRRINQFLHEEGGLPLESYDALLELFAAPDKQLRLRDLGERVVLTRSGVSRLVARLVDEGWVTKGTVDGDARGVYARLTTDGEAAFRATWPLYAEGIRRFFGSRMSVSDARQLATVLERIR